MSITINAIPLEITKVYTGSISENDEKYSFFIEYSDNGLKIEWFHKKVPMEVRRKEHEIIHFFKNEVI